MARVFTLVALLVVVLAPSAVWAQAPQPAPEPVYTIGTLLVGRDAPNAPARGVTATLSSSGLSALEAAEYAENLADLQEKIKSTFHLDQIEIVQSLGDMMAPGREMVLEGAGVRLVVRADGTLTTMSPTRTPQPDGTIRVGRTQGKAAQYNLHLEAAGQAVFDRLWTVSLGSRSILARQPTLGGPTYFIVIATPIPGTPMRTSLGISSQAYTVHNPERLDIASSGGVGGAVAGGATAGAVGGNIGGIQGGTGGGTQGGVGGGIIGGAPGGVGGATTAFVTQFRATGAAVRAPKLIHTVQPELDSKARAAGLKGQVVLAGTIDANGWVQDIKIVKGVEGLNELAIAAFKQWRYASLEPSHDGSTAVVQITVAFQFKGAPDQH